MNAGMFALPDEKTIGRKADGLSEVRMVTLEYLTSATTLYRRIMKGEANFSLISRAVTYLDCFLKMAPVAGIKKELYIELTSSLSEKLGKVLLECEDGPKEFGIRIEDGVKILEARPVKP